MTAVSDSTTQPPVKAPVQPPSTTGKVARFLVIAAITLGGALLFAARVNPARMDYISYWSAAKLLLHHGAPYSFSSVFALEKPLGFLPSKALMMRNPPWALFLVAPLGILGPRAGMVLWTIAIAACIIFSVHLLNPKSRDNALALLFAPAIACIGSGQSSPFLLLGFALFLYFHRSRPHLAGAALLLMAIKPHLFLVFWPVLLAEQIRRRDFRILAGCAGALALSSAVAMAIDVHIFPQYISMMRASALDHEPFPTLSMVFRLLIYPKAEWLLFVPSAVAVVWGLWYYARNRNVWDWNHHGMLLMLVTILASPYGWFTDEIVLLPSIIFALNFPQKHRLAGWVLLAVNALAAFVFTATGSSLETLFLVWTPLAWFAWFLYATHNEQSLTARDLATASLSGKE